MSLLGRLSRLWRAATVTVMVGTWVTSCGGAGQALDDVADAAAGRGGKGSDGGSVGATSGGAPDGGGGTRAERDASPAGDRDAAFERDAAGTGGNAGAVDASADAIVAVDARDDGSSASSDAGDDVQHPSAEDAAPRDGAVIEESNCADGLDDDDDELVDCADIDCSGRDCRPAAGPCDLAELCDGASGACPPDAMAPAGTVCRPTWSPGCDPAEVCDGTSCVCPRDARACGGGFCQADQMCGYTGMAGFDPCQPRRCDLTSICESLPEILPDGTPCDDGDPDSHAFAAATGCPPNGCAGGPLDGSACSTNRDCAAAVANANCVKRNFGGPACDGGAESGHYCKLVCVGGTFEGFPCQVDAECDGGSCPNVAASSDCPPAGRCVRWTEDPSTASCVATRDNPYCDSVADCPTTQYCAGDPDASTTGYGLADTCSTEGCCSGGWNYGPCLLWDACDTTNHVCVRTNQDAGNVSCGSQVVPRFGGGACVGGVTGFSGTTCNDVCRAGVCTQTQDGCP